MAKHKPETKEYIPEPDEGVYQTGAIQEPKGSSAFIAFLLLLVILLGGICSLLGLLNIRLLAQLSETPEQTLPMQMDTALPTTTSGSILDNLDDPVPTVPENRDFSLQIVDSPEFFTSQSAGKLLSAQEIYQRNRNSTVQVLCLTHFNATVQGMGLVLSADGYILTNSHVVDAAKRIFVQLPDGNLVRAALVGYDHFTDLAVLYVQRSDLSPAIFSSNRYLQVTEPTYALESAQESGLQESSVFSTSRVLTANKNAISLIQTCRGGTTGPVFDSFGNVIGFQVGVIGQYFHSADTTGVGLVIHTHDIGKIVRKLLSDGKVSGQPSLGIDVEAISKVYQQYWQLPGGLLLTNVAEDSNAAACGLQEGDILLALDGKPVHGRSDLYTILYNLSIGDEVIAVVRRNNQTFTVKLVIEDNAKQ